MIKPEDLKSLGFGEDGDTPEPDTNSVVNTIVEDHRTPGNLKSFLALLGYQRGTRNELRDLKHWLAVRFAYALGFIAALMIAFELWRSSHK